MKPTSRRTFLKLANAGLASALVPLAQSAGCARPVGVNVGTTQLPLPESPLTPTEAWYDVSLTGTYRADLARYRFRVAGLVERPLSLSVDDIRQRYPAVIQPITLACVGNSAGGSLLSSALFRGAPLSSVLEDAGAQSGATGALATGLEGYAAYQSLEVLSRPETILAYDMGISEADLAPLTVERGFPLRVLTPGLYGYVQPRWLDAINLYDHAGYHEVLRRSVDFFDGRMQLASGFSRPVDGDRLPPGDQEIFGYAFGDGRPISEVAIQVDGGGDWLPAEILYNRPDDGLPSFLWSLWRFRWNATPGEHALSCRATYLDGEQQRAQKGFPYSGGSLVTIKVRVS